MDKRAAAEFVQSCEFQCKDILIQDLLAVVDGTREDLTRYLERWYLKRGHQLFQFEPDPSDKDSMYYRAMSATEIRQTLVETCWWDHPTCIDCCEIGGHAKDCRKFEQESADD